MTRELLRPQVSDPKSLRERDEKLKTRQQSNFNHHHGVRELSPLFTGDGCQMDARPRARGNSDPGSRHSIVRSPNLRRYVSS